MNRTEQQSKYVRPFFTRHSDFSWGIFSTYPSSFTIKNWKQIFQGFSSLLKTFPVNYNWKFDASKIDSLDPFRPTIKIESAL